MWNFTNIERSAQGWNLPQIYEKIERNILMSSIIQIRVEEQDLIFNESFWETKEANLKFHEKFIHHETEVG